MLLGPWFWEQANHVILGREITEKSSCLVDGSCLFFALVFGPNRHHLQGLVFNNQIFC